MRSRASDCNVSRSDASPEPDNSASSPRPRPLSLAMRDSYRWRRRARRLVPSQDLSGERQISLRTLGCLVQVQRRDAITRRLGESNVARNHGAINLVAEVLLQIRRDVQRKRAARVVHGAQETFDFEFRIEVRAYAADGLHKIG